MTAVILNISIEEFPLTEINKVADMLRNGEIKGRAVIVPK